MRHRLSRPRPQPVISALHACVSIPFSIKKTLPSRTSCRETQTIAPDGHHVCASRRRRGQLRSCRVTSRPRPFTSVVSACVAASAYISIRIMPLLLLCKSTKHFLKRDISKLRACVATRRFHDEARSDVGTGASGPITSYRVEYASLPSSRRPPYCTKPLPTKW